MAIHPQSGPRSRPVAALSSILYLVHPAVSLFYLTGFFVVLFMFSHPLFLVTAFAGALLYTVYYTGTSAGRYLWFFLVFGLLMVIINVLTNHRGTHVIFMLGDKRYTWESFCYSVSIILLIGGLLLLFTVVNRILGSSKLLYLTSRVLPQTSFIVNMSLRYTGYLRHNADTYMCAQTIRTEAVAGEPTVKNSRWRQIRNIGGLLNGFIAWMLEDGMQTVETLRAKEYGQRRRTLYAAYTLRRRDLAFLALSVLALSALIALRFLQNGAYDYFRGLTNLTLTPTAWAAYALLLFYVLLPALRDFCGRYSIWN